MALIHEEDPRKKAQAELQAVHSLSKGTQGGEHVLSSNKEAKAAALGQQRRTAELEARACGLDQHQAGSVGEGVAGDRVHVLVRPAIRHPAPQATTTGQVGYTGQCSKDKNASFPQPAG